MSTKQRGTIALTPERWEWLRALGRPSDVVEELATVADVLAEPDVEVRRRPPVDEEALQESIFRVLDGMARKDRPHALRLFCPPEGLFIREGHIGPAGIRVHTGPGLSEENRQ
jgi:hypothetical protein